MTEQEKNAEEIKQLELECLRAFKAKDFSIFDRLFIEEALVCPPGVEAIFGKDNQKEMFSVFLEKYVEEMNWEPLKVQVSPSCEMAWVFGTVTWKLKGEAKKDGKYISVWEKHDGKWLNAVEIRNSNN